MDEAETSSLMLIIFLLEFLLFYLMEIVTLTVIFCSADNSR
jgi:hypothetical protein